MTDIRESLFEILNRDIVYKILNKLPLYDLQKLLGDFIESFPEYFKRRALELYGIENLKSDYLNSYEKYVQLAAFDGEIGKTSDLHVPKDKCFLYTAKAGNLELLAQFKPTGEYKATKYSSQVLRMNNLSLIKWIIKNDLKLEVDYIEGVKPEIYDYLVNLPDEPIIKVDFTSFFIGRAMPIKTIRRLIKISENGITTRMRDPHYDWPDILNSAASSLDYDRYIEVANVLMRDPNPLMKYYILDNPDIPEELVPKINSKITLFLGCPNIIKKYGASMGAGLNIFEFVPDLPRPRKLEMLNLVTEINKEDNLEIFKASLEWWTWIVKSKSSMKSKDEFDTNYYRNRLYDNLSDYIYNSKNTRLIKNWVKFTEHVSPYIDLVNFPELMPVVVENYKVVNGVSRFTSTIQTLENYFTPELYLKAFNNLTIEQRNIFLPTSDIGQRLKKSLYLGYVNRKGKRYPPIELIFLEPLRWYEDNIAKK